MLLSDASTWAQWGSWSKVEVEGGGPHAGPLTALVLRLAVRDACKRVAGAASDAER